MKSYANCDYFEAWKLFKSIFPTENLFMILMFKIVNIYIDF